MYMFRPLKSRENTYGCIRVQTYLKGLEAFGFVSVYSVVADRDVARSAHGGGNV